MKLDGLLRYDRYPELLRGNAMPSSNLRDDDEAHLVASTLGRLYHSTPFVSLVSSMFLET